MTSIDRLLRANRTIMQVPVYEKANGDLVIIGPTGTTTPFFTPSAAILEAWRQVTSTTATGAALGGNVSCAILDDVTLGMGESETDSELTICSIGNEATPTFANIEGEITGLRDRNKGDTGIFNLFTMLNRQADARYGWVDRIGLASTAAFANGQIISIYDSYTDVPIDVMEDRGNLKLSQSPSFTGNYLDRYTLV